MKPLRGISFIDVIVGSALVLVIFVALLGLLRASILVSSVAKAKAGATAIANNQMEYIRSLSYDSVGTVGGIPAGPVAQTATTSLNNINYGVRTLIEYVDDPADGTGSSDTNGITTDYKVIKVAVTYTIQNTPREVDLISNYVPDSIETTTGGGTLKISVVNAIGGAVAGASVRIQNSSTTPSVDLTTFTDSAGIVYLPGAATSTQYRVSVSKSGYSSAQTYTRDGTNQNPTPGYLTVVKNQTTTGTFAIDQLASFTLRTFYPIAASSTSDTFSGSAGLASLSGTTVTGSALQLLSGGNGYPLSGSAVGNATTPAYLSSWTSASSTLNTPAGTAVHVHVVDGSGALIPDSVLSGNSLGFSSFPIDLSGISTTTYPALGLSADLSTNSTSTTPRILDWTLAYNAGPIPVPNVPFSLTGTKTIGSTGAGVPIYKTSIATTTNASGFLTQLLEWDSYGFSLSGYDTVDACYSPPYSIAPGSSYDYSLYLAPSTGNSALVSVRDNAGVPVAGASVTLSRTGYTNTVTTSSCGTAYFDTLTAASTYTISASKSGYTTATYTGVSVSGHLFYATSFP